MKNKEKNIDFDDLIFQNRNKEYGAYILRKGYKRRFWLSLLIAFIFIICLCLLFFIKSKDYLPAPPIVKKIDVHIKEYKMPERPKESPKEKLKEQKEIQSKSSQIRSFKALDNNVISIPILKSKDTLDLENLSLKKIEGPDLQIKPILLELKSKDVSKIMENDIIKDNGSIKVQSLPHYPGGDSAWYQFLKLNINIHTILRNGALPANYEVVIAFLVHPDSTLSNIRIVKDPGYGAGYEALRIIKKSGKWIPGKKDNKPVIFAQLQTIIFNVKN